MSNRKAKGFFQHPKLVHAKHSGAMHSPQKMSAEEIEKVKARLMQLKSEQVEQKRARLEMLRT
jgi:hypothetical protein